MADRDFVLKWAHLGLGRNPRHRHILDEERRAFEDRVAEIWAEQEVLNAAREWPAGPALQLARRYAGGRPRLARHT